MAVVVIAPACAKTHEGGGDGGVADSSSPRDGRTRDTLTPPSDSGCTTMVCRPAMGPCDLEELAGCDGLCPPDRFAEDGVSCGLRHVCRGGACVDASCIDGARCNTGNACEDGRLRCDGVPRCVGVGSLPAGWTCSLEGECIGAGSCDGASLECPAEVAPAGSPCTGGSCDGAGSCVVDEPCGAPCSTGIPCELGEIDCSTGALTCIGVGPAPPGTRCGPDSYCDDFGMCADSP